MLGGTLIVKGGNFMAFRRRRRSFRRRGRAGRRRIRGLRAGYRM